MTPSGGSHDENADKDNKVVQAVRLGGAPFPAKGSNRTSWQNWQLYLLLNAIVCNSNNTLDSKYLNINVAESLLITHETLRNDLIDAWDSEHKSFAKIRGLEILRAKSDVSSDPIPSSGLSDGVKQGLLSALTRPYQGIAVDAFYEYLEQSHRYYLDEGRPQSYYAKFCSVVQSSGTGKTRVILELARKGVLLLYMNLRPEADKSGFPLRDDTPASILTGECKSPAQYTIQCCAFFSAIFKLIRVDLLARLEHDGAAAVENWNKDMCQLNSSYRAKFFERLQSTYEQIRNDFQLKKAVDGAADAMQTLSLEDTDKTSEGSKSDRGPEVELSVHYYKKLTEVLDSAFPNADHHQPKLVIALDEAHPLHEGINFLRSTLLFRVIKAYSAPRSPHAVWVVFASTTSKVADFASPQALFNSVRVSTGGELIFPPFCQLGWDQHAPALGTVPPGEVARVKHILRYGRPLWVSLRDMFLPNAIFSLAVNKLVGMTPYQGLDDQHALVVLAQRFGLDICFGHREAIRFVESTVAGHMRVCITTTEDRLWTYTTYPSEPLLSCAAAHSMHRTKNSLSATLHTLKSKVDNGMIDIGQCGELVSRLIWLLAKDFFVIRNKNADIHDFIGNGYDAELVHCRMVPVIEFFEFLFGDSFWTLADSNNCAGPDAKEAFQNAYVNFSHWVSMDACIRQHNENLEKAKDQLDLNEWTMRHWQRTCAVQCCHKQPSIDKAIPIYFKPRESGTKGVEGISQILISDKARTSKQHDALIKIQRSDPTIGGQEHSSDPLPYIVIVADLRLKDTGLESVTFPTRVSARTANDTRCLRLRACGLGDVTYPFLKHYPEVLEALKGLLERETTPAKPDRPLAEHLQDQVKYGSSGEGRYMKWEQGSMPLESWQK